MIVLQPRDYTSLPAVTLMRYELGAGARENSVMEKVAWAVVARPH